MALAVLAVLAAPHVILPACSWDRPGHNRFTGDVAAAVRHYADIPAPVVARLRQRIQARDFDDLAEIRRDSIEGRYRYEPALRDMHFGSGQICRSPTRAGWAPEALERGMVYCEAGHCLIVPTVCGNLSRVTRLPADQEGRAEGPGAASHAGSPSTLVPDQAWPPASEPGPSFDDVTAMPPGGLSPASVPLVAAPEPGAGWLDDRYTTRLPDPTRPAPGGSVWGEGDDGPGAAGLFPPRAPDGVLPAPTPAVPEPPVVWLWGLGLAGLAALRTLRTHRPGRRQRAD